LIAKHKMEKTNRIAKALMRAGWYANATMRSDGIPLLYVRVFSFEKLLLEAVDEGLSSLCNSSKQAIYSLLENTFNINRLGIPYKIEDFADAIEKIFGLGAKPIEILIIRRLNEKVGEIVEYPRHENLVFAEYVAAARQSFLKKKKRFMRVHSPP
jgi:glutaredoxin 2